MNVERSTAIANATAWFDGGGLFGRLHGGQPVSEAVSPLFQQGRIEMREDRLVLTLLDVEGFSVAEISEMTNWSISKVKVRAHRARAHLRRIMKKFV